MVAGDGVDRLRKAFKRHVKIALVVNHGSRRIDDVGTNDEELDVVALTESEITVDQRILGGVAFAWVTDDNETEVTLFDARRRHLKQGI